MQQPFHACSGRPTVAGGVGGEGRWAVATAGGGKDEEDGEPWSCSSDSSSDYSDDDDDNEEEEKEHGGTGPPRGGSDSKGNNDDGSRVISTSTSRLGQDAAEVAGAHEGEDVVDTEGGGGQQSGERYDYRSIGSEIYEGGDLEAGEAMQGMYDFVDDIVETQHVPTIQDPFDHKGRFHR